MPSAIFGQGFRGLDCAYPVSPGAFRAWRGKVAYFVVTGLVTRDDVQSVIITRPDYAVFVRLVPLQHHALSM
jgi:hypothetical protein